MVVPVTYTVWQLKADMVELKPTYRVTVINANRIGNTHTLRKDIREWTKLYVKDRWYLSETANDEVQQWWAPGPAPRISRVLRIHFRNPKDAVLFKLTWL